MSNSNDQALCSGGLFNKPSEKVSGEEVVISGISGIFPASKNVAEFMANLNKKVDMVSKSNNGLGFAKIDGITKFDATFFRVNYKQAMVMDPTSRMLLEQAYSAIFDAGINPMTLKGRRIGVFIGSTYTDNNCAIYDDNNKNIYTITGNGCKSMNANRISYWIDSKAPSYNIESTCSASLVCLDKAIRSIKTGECESAVVGGANLCIHPTLTKNLERAEMCSTDGSLAENYRSDAINVIFLQKLKHAKRIYAEVYYTQVGYNLKSDSKFLPIRKSADLEKALADFLSAAKISSHEVEYVETSGSGVDELEAVLKVFNKNKYAKVGNVKTFMGNSEPASGICSLTKICLAYHNGRIAAGLCPKLVESNRNSTRNTSHKFIQEIQNFNRGFAAINNISFGGLDAHILLKSHYKKKKLDKARSCLPSLVFASGRNEACVNKFFGILKSEPLDAEQIALLHNIHNTDTPGHTYRGYTILEADALGQNTILSEGVQLYSGRRRPLWFVYSGMGSQWPEMGLALLRIPTFAAAIERCHKVLEPRGVNIFELLTKPDPRLFDNILNSFVGIAAIQIGLTDLLNEMNIVPDYIIGHSVGELGCGYADGCLTAEEMILAAYSRGLVSIQTSFIHGSMAAIGLGYREVQRLCPTEIEVACRNSSTSSTISGPSGIVKKFVAQLRSKGIFAKEVQVSNIAYHSKYIEHAGPALLKRFKEVIKSPKLRSKKWICTSLPSKNWDDHDAKYCSAEYHTNNLLNPVYFEEPARLIPPEAVLIEIAPHGLLQAILKRSHPSCFHISLTKRWHSNPVKFLMEGLGTLYELGFNPHIHVLYPKIEYPVSTETPFLSHFVDWEHSEEWPIIKLKEEEKIRMSARDLLISVHDDEYKYLYGYGRNGKNILPEAAILYFVWETLAKFRDEELANTSVVFKNVNFCNEIVMTSDRPLKLSILINKGRGFVNFEVCYSDDNIVNGFIDVSQNTVKKYCNNVSNDESQSICDEENTILRTEDIYRMLNYRGFKLRAEFHSIVSIDYTREKAFIKYSNWISLIDSLIQLKTISTTYAGVSVPKFLTELVVNTNLHKETDKILIQGIKCYSTQISNLNQPFRCAGVTIEHIIFEDLPLNVHFGDVIEELLYVPHINDEIKDVDNCLRIMLQIVTDNIPDNEVNIFNALSESASIGQNVEKVIESMVRQSVIDTHMIDKDTFDKAIKNNKQLHLVIVDDLTDDEKKHKLIEEIALDTTFILTLDKNKADNKNLMYYEIISEMDLSNETLLLLKRKQRSNQSSKVYIHVINEFTFSWIPKIYKEKNSLNEVILISERDPYCGLLGFVRKLNKTWKTKIRLFIVDDFHAPTFNPKNRTFQKQLQKNLNINIYKQRQWGGYYSLPVQNSQFVGTVTLTLTNNKDIESLTWIELKTAKATQRTIEVHFAGLSMHDLKMVSGEVKLGQNGFGMDFSGIDERGNKVMGLLNSGALATTIEADEEFLWPVPENWSLEDAVTVPFPYIYAYYCLMIKGELQYGQTVFVNSGAGAIGQAVITICLALNCTVYTTVSDNSKKTFLLRLFPQLKVNNIFDSKDDCFYMWLKSFNHKRCNFVINSATGLFKKAAMNCVGSIGIFLNLCDVDRFSDEQFGMSYLDEDRNYKNVHLACLFDPEHSKERKLLRRVIAEGIADGTVRPLSRVVCTTPDISRAFKLLASRRRIGRVLIKMKDSTASNNLGVIPRASYSSKGVYIVICDENQLGIELADHLVRQGVTKINIHQKPNKCNGYLNERIKTWRDFGVEANAISSYMETKEDFVNIIKEGTTCGDITGIFIVQNISSNCCEVLEQRDFDEKFKETASTVAQLDILSRGYCTELSEFVVITQTTNNLADEYVASVCEKICTLRKDLGLPGLALRVHLMDQFPHQNDNQSKMEPQPIPTVFKTMDRSLKLNSGIVHTFNIRQTKQCDDKHETKGYGFRNFFKFIEKDEVLASEPVVRMRTLLSTEAEESSSPDTTDSCLLLIPGFEGHHRIFSSLCEGLKIKSIVLQLGPDLTEGSISEMASSIRKSMAKSRIQPKSKFYLLGYSFGVNIALELAAVLEKEGLKGVVYCLDSSPDMLKMHLYTLFDKQPFNDLQDYILENIYELMTSKTNPELADKLKDIGDWPSKVEACTSFLKGSGYTKQYTKAIIGAVYNRFNLAMNYDTDIKLDSKLILIKGNTTSATAFNNEYNLSRFTTQAVEVIKMKLEHVTVPFDIEISNVVNKYLDTDVLTMYKGNDFCNSYFRV